MKRQAKPQFFQEHKRARRNKKAYFRGTLEQSERSVWRDPPVNIVIPRQYFVLVSLFVTAMLCYLPLIALSGEMQTTSTALITNLSALWEYIRQVHIHIPRIAITFPHIPALPMPHIVVPPISTRWPTLPSAAIDYQGIQGKVWNIGIRSRAILSYLNPIPYLMAFYTLRETLTLYFLAESVSLVLSTATWIKETLGILLGKTAIGIGVTAVGHIALLGQTIMIIGTAFVEMQNTITTGTEVLVFLILQTLLHIGIVVEIVMFHVVVFLTDVIIALVTAIWQWIVSIVAAIKRSLDNFFGAIDALVHQGDPVYNFIGSSVADSVGSLFTNIHTMFSEAPKVIHPGGV